MSSSVFLSKRRFVSIGKRRFAPKPVPASFTRYQREAAAWITTHLDATPAEREAALRAISKACGA